MMRSHDVVWQFEGADAAGDAAAGDAAAEDTGVADAGSEDVWSLDAEMDDSAQPDTTWADTGSPDTGSPDTGSPDTVVQDSAMQDVAPPDAGTTDADALEAGPLDVGSTDAGTPDAGPPDTTLPDAGPADTATTDAGLAGEPCNKLDDDGDDLVDEGCLAPPNMIAGQKWLDRGLYQNAFGPMAAPLVLGAVPANEHRALAVARDQSNQAALLWADGLRAPDGKVWLSGDTWKTSPNRGGPNVGISSLLVGASEPVVATTGDWQVGFARTLSMPDPNAPPLLAGWVHVGWLLAPPLGQAAATIDVDVYCIGAQPYSAAKLAQSPLWSALVARINQLWTPAKLKVGKVTFTDVLGDDGKKYLFVDNVAKSDDSNELNGLMALSAIHRPASTAVSIYLVAAMLDDDMPVASGITGQLGGVAGMQGSKLSGIAIALPVDEVEKGMKIDPTGELLGDTYGAVVSHEIGHFLGLWHPVERTGSLSDPVQDTPGCTPPAGTEIWDAAACPAAAKNLMFWAYDPKGTGVSAGQAKVVRRHPCLRSVP